jgi:hypothetical protein
LTHKGISQLTSRLKRKLESNEDAAASGSGTSEPF